MEFTYRIKQIKGRTSKYYLSFGLILATFSLYFLSILVKIQATLDVDVLIDIAAISLIGTLIALLVVLLKMLPLVLRKVIKFLPIKTKNKYILRTSFYSKWNQNKLVIIVLTISISTIILLSTFLSSLNQQELYSVKKSQGADIVVSNPQSPYTLANHQAREFLEFEGVESISKCIRSQGYSLVDPTASFQISDISQIKPQSNIFLTAIDENYKKSAFSSTIRMDAGNFDEGFAQMQTGDGNYAMISQNTAAFYSLQVNDLFQLRFSSESWDGIAIFTVVGIYEELPFVDVIFETETTIAVAKEMTCFISLNTFNEFMGGDAGDFGFHTSTLIKCKEDTDLETTRGELSQANPALQITYFQDRFSAERMRIKAGAVFIFLIFIAISVINLLNTMKASLKNEQTTLQTLRLIGFSQQDLAKKFQIEMFFIIGVALVVGFLFGNVLGFFYHNILALLFNSYGQFLVQWDVVGYLVILFFAIPSIYINKRITRQLL